MIYIWSLSPILQSERHIWWRSQLKLASVLKSTWPLSSVNGNIWLLIVMLCYVNISIVGTITHTSPMNNKRNLFRLYVRWYIRSTFFCTLIETRYIEHFNWIELWASHMESCWLMVSWWHEKWKSLAYLWPCRSIWWWSTQKWTKMMTMIGLTACQSIEHKKKGVCHFSIQIDHSWKES